MAYFLFFFAETFFFVVDLRTGFFTFNLARWKNVDAESVLWGTNAKFKKRFAYVEQGAKMQGRNLSELSLEEMESLWQEAKGRE